jgi:predicted Zn-dependent protease
MEGQPQVAEKMAREAVTNDRLDPFPWQLLAEALAFQGKLDESEKAEQSVIALLQPDEREEELRRFGKLLDFVRSHPPSKP